MPGYVCVKLEAWVLWLSLGITDIVEGVRNGGVVAVRKAKPEKKWLQLNGRMVKSWNALDWKEWTHSTRTGCSEPHPALNT